MYRYDGNKLCLNNNNNKIKEMFKVRLTISRYRVSRSSKNTIARALLTLPWYSSEVLTTLPTTEIQQYLKAVLFGSDLFFFFIYMHFIFYKIHYHFHNIVDFILRFSCHNSLSKNNIQVRKTLQWRTCLLYCYY